MKRLHLVCNSHLDPVWMWSFDEGIAMALSTFRTAAEFCEEYDYIFCHNEAILYEYIERYDQELFAKIQKLVAKGKWHIMGGWYLQPDCHLPSGESFIRQARSGIQYFKKKFGVRPTTAINFDSFGHSRGLVQILTKCGYDSYLICRPMPKYLDLPSDQFNWIGYDGSKIKVCRIADDLMYSTEYGKAKEFIKIKAQCWKNYEAGIALWGVGNHGGNPSRKDLKEVNELIDETQEYEIVHSTPEKFFGEVHPNVDYYGQLSHFLIGCYSSLAVVKKKHIELETALYMTEKICAVAELTGKNVWNYSLFSEAERALLTLEFHDSLSGTMVESAEKDVLCLADYALNILSELRNKAFFSIVNDDLKAEHGVYPIFVFNSSPYCRDTVVECEILVLDPIISDTEHYNVTVTHKGEVIQNQVIKQESNINYDRRKRIAFKASLPPLSIDRFDVEFSVAPIEPQSEQPIGDIIFKDKYKKVIISEKTGLIESYVADGKEYLSGGAFLPVIYDDIADSWGWDIDRIGSNQINAELSDKGIFEGLKKVHIIEQGEILTEVEALFAAGNSTIRISYKLYRDLPYIDVNLDVLWNETQKCLKLKIPSVNGKFIGQTAYGTDEFLRDGRENVAQRFVSLIKDDKSLSIFNNCCYGCSADDENLYLTLLRGIGYCTHPIEDRKLIADDRYIPYAEQGKHTFSFRMSVNNPCENDRIAVEFCEKPYAVNAFPDGHGISEKRIIVENSQITLSALFKEKDGIVFRLFNNSDVPCFSDIIVEKNKIRLSFGKYEIKTLLFSDGVFTERRELL